MGVSRMSTEDEIESHFGLLKRAQTEDICKESTWLVVQNVMVLTVNQQIVVGQKTVS